MSDNKATVWLVQIGDPYEWPYEAAVCATEAEARSLAKVWMVDKQERLGGMDTVYREDSVIESDPSEHPHTMEYAGFVVKITPHTVNGGGVSVSARWRRVSE